jgi:flagellin
LQRIRDLATQAANSIYDTDAMSAMKQEVDARIAEIERISKATTFNGLHLLDADAATNFANGLRLQVGANADAAANSITVPASVFSQTDCTTLGTGASVNAGSSVTNTMSVASGATQAFSAATSAASYIAVVSKAIDEISNKKSTIGAIMNRLESAEATLATTIENSTAAKSTIMDADIAEESMEFTKHQILQQTSSALLVQANALPQIAISLVQG